MKPHLEQILSLHDFEAVARRTMARRGWNYYSSGADDEITLRENHNAYGRVWFRPRVLRNVAQVDYSTSIFGYKTSMPVYITATALGKCRSHRARAIEGVTDGFRQAGAS